MNIGGVRKNEGPQVHHKASKEKPRMKANSATSPNIDTFEHSPVNGAISVERMKELKLIREKIQNGYYSTPEVSDDLSETFAKLFGDNI